jgi:Do/DeqQ family serine protease
LGRFLLGTDENISLTQTKQLITMKQSLKLFGVALLGGMVALGGNQLLQDKVPQNMQSKQVEVQQVQKAQPVNFSAPLNIPTGIQVDFTEAAEKSVHAVVYIMSEFKKKSSVYDDYFSPEDFFFRGMPNVIRASGSGVILSSDGYIVTNNHVVQQASRVRVTLNDKREYDARIVGTDPSTDLALLKIDAKNLPFLTFGNSDNVKVGEWVLAVGNPFNLTSTVTAGIVSAKARNINILGSQTSIESFIQTDAAVNPGNSGGALVNTKGQLIGVNAAIASRTGSYIGYSFAIPVSIVKKVVNDLKEFGEVKRAYIGVTYQNMNSKLADKLGIDKLKGVYIEGVIHGGAAEKAGIKPGSILTKIGDNEINSGSELLEKVGMHRPGDKIQVTAVKDGKSKTYDVVLTDLYGNTSIKEEKDETVVSMRIGAKFAPVDNRMKQELRIDNGVVVVDLSDGVFSQAGIRKGFIIQKIDQSPVYKPSDVEKILSKKKGGVLIEGIYPNGVKAFYGFGL